MTKPQFVHLRIHSDYSMIDGIAKIKPLIKKAVELNMPALAITDFTNLCGLIKFYNTAHNMGIKPIIGADFLVKNESLNDEAFELTVLAANNIGYQYLILLISDAYRRGYGPAGPMINRDWLISYNEGLILLSGACKGEVGKYILRGNKLQAEKSLAFYSHYFPNRYYIELIRTDRNGEENYLHSAVKLAIDWDLPVVATNDVRFINKDDFYAHEIRVAINNGYTIDDIKRPKNYSPQQYMRSEREMCELFADLPEALVNTVEIAQRCNVTIRLGEYFLPKFPTGKLSIEDYLVKYAQEGLEQRLKFIFVDENLRKAKRRTYDERLASELQVINNMGFPGYFLIVMEFIQWSKKNNIPVGPGRGSGAGSLVAYALNITDLDPLKFNLIFERFLNPERISMPDFDIDFCMEKRDLVINHVTETYGYDAVAQIITFGTMAAKAVIRDVGRVLGYPYSFVDRIAKLVPSDPGMTLKKAFVVEPLLQEIYKTNEEIKILIDIARKLEGVTRNASKHAGGVVISPTKITDFMPIYCDSEGNYPITQFDKNDVEDAGLVKFDFLGLRTLTIIHCALNMININRTHLGLQPIDISTISLEDKESFNMLQRSETTAVFQLESRGMKDLIKRLQPDCFEDIIALVALFRPGPLQSGMVDNFINRKHGYEPISYPDSKWQHQSLKSILEPTYGIILYQEQVMQIAQILAGYTLGGADILRRAMSKKKLEEMDKQREIFKAGAKNIGIDNKLSMKIFDLVEKFSGYGFNKSHSAAYALVSYHTLWLKAHYPAEFMAAVMTADMDNTEKIVGLIEECQRMGLKILPPNINISEYHFHVNKHGEIVYGIGAIKGVGEGLVAAIIKARNQNGCFRELFDLCARTNIKKLNRRVLEKLIMAGAFDCFGQHRAALMNSLSAALKVANQYTKAVATRQDDMFGLLTNKLEVIKTICSNVAPWSKQVTLNGERETLGLYLTEHPIDQYLPEIEKYISRVCIRDVHTIKHGKTITVVGFILSTQINFTKQGHKIGFCTLDDHSGRLEVKLFKDTLEKYEHLLQKEHILVIQGQINFKNLNAIPQIIADKLINISEVREKYVHSIMISLYNEQINNQFFNRIHSLLEKYKIGAVPVQFYYQKQNVLTQLRFKNSWQVIPSDCLLNDLRALIGYEQVKLKFKECYGFKFP